MCLDPFGINLNGIIPVGMKPCCMNLSGVNPSDGVNPSGINLSGVNPIGINP